MGDRLAVGTEGLTVNGEYFDEQFINQAFSRRRLQRGHQGPRIVAEPPPLLNTNGA
jgi:hypothetical protein